MSSSKLGAYFRVIQYRQVATSVYVSKYLVYQGWIILFTFWYGVCWSLRWVDDDQSSFRSAATFTVAVALLFLVGLWFSWVLLWMSRNIYCRSLTYENISVTNLFFVLKIAAKCFHNSAWQGARGFFRYLCFQGRYSRFWLLFWSGNWKLCGWFLWKCHSLFPAFYWADHLDVATIRAILFASRVSSATKPKMLGVRESPKHLV